MSPLKTTVVVLEWKEGINPYLDEHRKQLIRDARQQRADQLEAWQAGAGKRYLEEGLTPWPRPFVHKKK